MNFMQECELKTIVYCVRYPAILALRLYIQVTPRTAMNCLVVQGALVRIANHNYIDTRYIMLILRLVSEGK